MRWPDDSEVHAPAVISLLLNYFNTNGAWKTFADIDNQHADLIFRNTPIKYISQLCSTQETPTEIFKLAQIDGNNYNDRDFLAEIISFLLQDKDQTGAQRKRMSLKRAHFASQNGLFSFCNVQSAKTFSSLWRRKGVAAAFYYVETYHSPIDFDLDPWSATFKSDVDDIISEPAVMKRYLAQVKFVVQALIDRLDPRARSALAFPAFPMKLAPENVRPTPFRSDLTAVMRKYINA